MASSHDGESSYFSYLDVFLLGVFILVLFLIVRKFRRRARGDDERVKKLQINPVIKQISSPVYSSSLSTSGSFIDKMKTRKKRVLILYGSQTGTGEEFSNRLAKDSSRLGLPAMTFDPEDCTDWDDLTRVGQEVEGSLVIFVMATYGEGDPTDNAQEFFDWLKETTDNLQGLKYTVFGLGNKTYEHYNEMGRYVDQRLEELGGERIYVRGEGDDDGNIEEDFITWKEGLWPEVMQYFKIDSSQATAVGREYEFSLHTEISTDEVFTGEPNRLGSYKNQKVPYNSKNPFLAPVTVIRELHKGGDRSCMHIELDITGSKLSYVAGDHVAIFPMNDPQQVERIGELLGIDLDSVFSLTNVDPEATKPHPFPCPTNKKLGATLLFFGCRNCAHDYLYQEELEEYESKGILSGLYVAFSREQIQFCRFVSRKEVWELIEGQGFFYVCGDARNMARDVQNTLLSIIKEHGGKTETEATEYIKKLQKRGRYLQDVWS
uniref:NADPH--hemoprotein reductase n=1 Tax=Amphimedon queenslandica TaxID=400682 RepID=A0A1X7VJ30_AMPQE